MISEVAFGKTGLRVSRLCLGSGSSGDGCESVQGRQQPQDYARVLVQAASLGVRFWDTSIMYGTHPHLRLALEQVGSASVVVSTKSHASSFDEMEAAVQKCRQELGREVLDIFLMHEVDSLEQYEARRPAWKCLGEHRQAGTVRVRGLSTHSIEVLERAAADAEVEAIFTNYNLANLHMDASIEDYERALKQAYARGAGVYVHKTLAEGRLADRFREALMHNLSKPFIHSVCVGITSEKELRAAVEVASAREESSVSSLPP